MAEGDWPLWTFSRATDPEGHFEAWVPPGIYHVTVDPTDRLIETGMRIEVTTADVTGLMFHTRRGAMVSGRIEPAVLADIAVVERKESHVGVMGMNLARARVQTTDTGEFTVGPVPPGELEISALTLDGRAAKLSIDVVDTDIANLVLSLEPGRKVAGRVIDTNGKPVAGMFVMQRLADGPIERRFHRDGQAKYSTTDAAGRFEIVGLETEYYIVMVDGEQVEVDLTTGDVLDVVVKVPARNASIRGRVVDEHGSPVRGLYVSASTRKRHGTRSPNSRRSRASPSMSSPVRRSSISLSSVRAKGLRRTTRAAS